MKHVSKHNIASHKLDDIQRLTEELQKKQMLKNYTHSACTIAIIIAALLVLFILYKIYKKCTNKSTCCGIVPNLCIKVNQLIESIPNLNNPVVRYSRNIATIW